MFFKLYCLLQIMARYGFQGRISEFVEFLNKNRTTEFYNRSRVDIRSFIKYYYLAMFQII